MKTISSAGIFLGQFCCSIVTIASLAHGEYLQAVGGLAGLLLISSFAEGR